MRRRTPIFSSSLVYGLVLGMFSPVFCNKPGEGGDAGGGSGAGGDPNKPGEGDNKGGEGDGGKPPVATIPKSQFDALLTEKKRSEEARKKAENELAQLKANTPSPEELEELRQARVEREKADEERKKAAGQFDLVLAKHKTEAQAALAAKEQEIAKLKTHADNLRIDHMMATTIPQFTQVPVAEVRKLFRENFKVDPESNEIVPLNDKGERALTETGAEISAEQHLENLINGKSWLVQHKPNGGSGGTSQRGGRGANSKMPTDAEIAAMNDEEFRNFEKTYMGSGARARQAG